MAYTANKQAVAPSDAALETKTDATPNIPEFTPDQFSFQATEGYKQAELPHKADFKPLAVKWQFRWFGFLEGINQSGRPEQGYFKVIKKGDGYQGFPFSQMFCEDAWDASGFITRFPRRDPNTGSLVFDQVLCARPHAAWEANQEAIAKRTKDRLGPDKNQNAVQSQVQNIVTSEISVVSSELKQEADAGRW